MEEYGTPVEEILGTQISDRKFYGMGDSNCYGVIYAGLNDDPDKLGSLNNTVLNNLKPTEIYEIFPKNIKLQLYELLDKGNNAEIKEFYKTHNNEIFSYIKIIKNFLTKHKDKIIIIEFLDSKGFSQHVAFITPDMKVYDKVCNGKFNLGNHITDMFEYWNKWSRSYRLYSLNSEQTKNVRHYIDYLIHQSKI